MDAKHLLERALILALLFIIVLQLGGAAVRADLSGPAARESGTAQTEEVAERCCRMVGFPHNDIEACQMLMQFFR